MVDEATFNSLSKKLRDGYGDAETVTVKTQTFVARRYTVYSIQQDAPATVESILALFEKLHPAEQIDRLVLRSVCQKSSGHRGRRRRLIGKTRFWIGQMGLREGYRNLRRS